MSQGYGQFESHFQWLPKNGGLLPEVVVNVFLDEVEKGRWHHDKILVSWDVCVYVVQEVAVASLILSLKDPRQDPGVWLLSSSPGGWLV